MRHINPVEAMKGYRPIETNGWVAGLAQKSCAAFGSEALDFEDDVLGDQALLLMTPDQIAAVHERTRGLFDGVVSSALVDMAVDEMPESFGQPAEFEFASEILARDFKDEEGESKQTLVAPIRPQLPFLEERASLMQAVEKSSKKTNGSRLPWTGSNPELRMYLRLAVILDGSYYMPGDPRLVELAGHLPKGKVPVAAGKLEPAMAEASSLARR